MAVATNDISDLLSHLHSRVDVIHRSMRELCDPESHNTRVSRLEEECVRKVAELRSQHEMKKRETETNRRTKQKEVAERRRKEEQDIAERRRREDEERKSRIKNEEIVREKEIREEDQRREIERVASEHAATSSAREEIERLEGEMRKRWEEGRAKVKELDNKRKEINRKIDEMLAMPMEYPKVRSIRKTTRSTENSNGLVPPLSDMSHLHDSLLERLRSGEKYTLYAHIETRQDPMLSRLWDDKANGQRQRDPMLVRLWSDIRYIDSTIEEQSVDPMLHRLWANTRYPNERYISVIYNPMIERLWEDLQYHSEVFVPTVYDPMLSRLWNTEKYTSGDGRSHHDDPMLSRLWNGEQYGESKEVQDPMMQRLWSAARYREDPMIDRLWSSTRYREDPMIDRLWGAIRYREDPMIDRLWGSIRYREDPMLSRLWSSATYTSDPMMDRLWNGAKYSETDHQHEEPQVVLYASQPPEVKSPIPKSPIPMGLYLHTEKYPEENVSEVQDVSEDENEDQNEEEDIAISSKRQSGVFTAFFNSIKTDLPLVNDYFGNQEYDSVPIEDFDAFVQNEPLLYHAPDEQHVHFEDLLPPESHDFDPETDEEFPFRSNAENELSSTSLRIQTSIFQPPLSQNPFEMNIPSSGVPSSPATPSDTESHAFQHLDMHQEQDRRSIPDSWSPPREEVHLTPRMEKPVTTTNHFAPYMQPSITSSGGGVAPAQSGITKPVGRRSVGNHFNSVPQNPRLSSVAEVEGAEEETGGVRERAAFFGRLSRMYYGGSGEERGRLLESDK